MRLRELIESVNAASAAMIRSARALSSDDDNDSQNNESKNDEADTSKEEVEEGLWNFEPAKGNVVFCSALHGWGFTVPSLARSLFRSKTVPIKPPVLRQYLFDDVKYRRKDCKVIKWKRERSGADDENMTMFSEFALKPLWDAYEGVSTAAACVDVASGRVSKIKADTPGMDGLLASMQIGSTASVVANNDGSDDLHSNPQTMEQMQRILQKTGANSLEAVLRAMLRRYRPLSDAVLDAACEHCPDPSVASSSIRTRALAVDDFPSDSTGLKVLCPVSPVVLGLCPVSRGRDLAGAPQDATVARWRQTMRQMKAKILEVTVLYSCRRWWGVAVPRWAVVQSIRFRPQNRLPQASTGAARGINYFSPHLSHDQSLILPCRGNIDWVIRRHFRRYRGDL